MECTRREQGYPTQADYERKLQDLLPAVPNDADADGGVTLDGDDGLGLGNGSYSATVERVHEVLVDCSIDDNGYMNFETDERLGLVYDMDEEGRLVVYYLEED